ncbi:SgrR family transcriptional regulator [Vogesella sp. LIG4]|uniref:SgrR family transcriptional regulator n=1 Tax=Vogesella sp. LIG4 TaxID=1192162 RepID=UPI00081F7B63|nr:SgrR family transcriptional regulator [Vogesella sp. LIG4]SCK05873.1 SgrR family transcriptional regulator [Vogesella sp. LIG4]
MNIISPFNMRDLQHYQRLYAARHGQSGNARLDELSQALNCSPRHCRQILQRLAAHGWLQWQPGRGRGHTSTLTLLAHPATLEHDAIQQQLARGELEQVLQNLTPASRQRLREVIPSYLGLHGGSSQRLRLPFYRPLHSLDPAQINRRTECHLVRQLFDGLTRFNPQQQRIEPALAHHWQADDSLQQWRFFLRPGVVFHHGRPLEGEDVRQTLYRLRDEPGPFQQLFSHLVGIELPAAHEVVIRLRQPDALLPHRLADSCASILPRERWPQADFARLPSGTGAFRLTVNNDYRATLQAFERHWRERALLDEVDIWVLPELDSRARLDARISSGGELLPSKLRRSQLEPGCCFVMVNPAKPAFASQQQRQAWQQWLHPAHWRRGELYDAVGQLIMHDIAHGLLPGWQQLPAAHHSSPPELPASLHLVTYQLPSNLAEARQLATRLAAAGCRLEITVLPYPEFAQGRWRAHADLMLCGEVCHDDVDFSLYQWLSSEHIFQPWLPAALRQQLDTALRDLAAEADASRRMAGYQATASMLLADGGILPLSHYTLHLDFDPALQGIELSQCGWMDFRSLWLLPADSQA